MDNIKHSSYVRPTLTYPYTRTSDQVNDFFGIKVPDPYNWLEDYSDPEVIKWVNSQSDLTQAYLDGIPFRSAIKNRCTTLMSYAKISNPICAGEVFLFCKQEPLQKQPIIYVQQGDKGVPEVLINPNDFSEEGTISMQILGVSSDNRYVSITSQEAGSDWSAIFVMEIATKRQLPGVLKSIKYPIAAWKGAGFYYSRYTIQTDASDSDEKRRNHNSVYYHSVYYHKVGEPQEHDVLIYEDKKNPELHHFVGITEDEKYLLRYTVLGTGKYVTYYASTIDRDAHNFIPLNEDYLSQSSVILHVEGKFLVLTNQGAPNGKVVSVDIHAPSSDNWKCIIPEAPYPIYQVYSGGGKLFLQYIKEGTIHCSRYDYDGTNKKDIKLPCAGSLEGFWGDERDNKVFYTLQSFLHPRTIFRYDIRNDTSEVFLRETPSVSLSKYQERQVTYTSTDGKQVNMFIVCKKDTRLDGGNLCFLDGYGGFGDSAMPCFGALPILLIERGGVFAQPQIRGGIEQGEEWHREGTLANKQKVFDDFIAAAEYLIDKGYTSPKKLVITGMCNGGLLVGACTNQRPDLFAVAMPNMGIMDMLRYHHFTSARLWIPEYGSSDNEEQFKTLYTYSPLHNIQEGGNYPAIMAMSSNNDDRVVPMHSFKYVAQLQKFCEDKTPKLLRLDSSIGHGLAMPAHKLQDKIIDQLAFAFYNTNTKW